MKQGMSLAKLSEELDFRHENRRDFIVATETIAIDYVGQDEELPFAISFQQEGPGRKSRIFDYNLTHHTLSQIASYIGIPLAVIDKIGNASGREAGALAHLMTTRMQCLPPTNKLIRTLLGGRDRTEMNAIAFLSDRYRPLDNYGLLQAIFPVIRDLKGLAVASCDLTETKLYIKLRYPKIKGSLGKVKEVDDIVEAGVTIANSEVGDGAISVRPYLLRLTCLNGATISTALGGSRKIHIGTKLTDPSTRQRVHEDDIFERIADTIKKTLTDETYFKRIIKQFKASKQQPIENVAAAIRVLAQLHKLSETEREGLGFLMRGAIKSSRFHLINAVTRMAQNRNKEMTYIRATELENLGGHLIEMSNEKWKRIGSAKPNQKYVDEEIWDNE